MLSGAAAWRPGAKVRIYATTALRTDFLDQAYQAIINDLTSQPGLRQVSMSFGIGEGLVPLSQLQTDAQFFATMAGAGVTAFAASGDIPGYRNNDFRVVIFW